MKVKLFESLSQAQQILKEKEPRLVKAQGKNICIVMMDKNLIAFENECPHMGENLHHGKINFLSEIVCPLHSYRFSLNTGEEANQKCASLKFISVEISDSVYLSF